MNSRGSRALLAVLLLSVLAGRSLKLSAQHPFPVFDEVAYLDLARDFASRGGAAAAVSCYVRGECREDNRHPLYPMLLADALGRPPADFARAKLLSLGIAAIFCAAMFAGAFAVGGEAAAWLCFAASALSPAVARLSHTLGADLLFAGLFFSAAAAIAVRNAGPRRWAACGVLAGLAYLAKGNGHVLLLAPAAAALWRWRGEAWRRPEPYLALGGFAAAASFLLIRNARVWGDPLHNVNMAYLWLDSWGQSWFVPANATGPLMAVDYLARHSSAEMAARLARGALECARALAVAAAPGPDDGAWSLLAGTATLLLAAKGAARRWKEGRGAELAAFLPPSAFLYAAFSWGAKALGANERFMVPLAASLWPFAALEACALWKRRPHARPASSRAAWAALALGCLLAWGRLLQDWRDPRTLWAVPENWRETSAWLARNAPEGFLISSQSAYSSWDCCRDKRRPFPFDAAPELIRSRMREADIGHLLLDRYAPAPGGPRAASDAHGPLAVLGLPRCFHDSAVPSVFLVYGRCGVMSEAAVLGRQRDDDLAMERK